MDSPTPPPKRRRKVTPRIAESPEPPAPPAPPWAARAARAARATFGRVARAPAAAAAAAFRAVSSWWPAQATPSVGDHVTVTTGFMSDSDDAVFLRAGLQGTVEEVYEDGDVVICSDQLDRMHWVSPGNFRHITFRTPDTQQQPQQQRDQQAAPVRPVYGRRAAPSAGDHATVTAGFVSDNEAGGDPLRAGLHGVVGEVDEDGDAHIEFFELPEGCQWQWVRQHNFGHITFWRPVVGQHVTVRTAFISDSRQRAPLRAGVEGIVVQVDQEGDVLIESEELTKEEWVRQCNFTHLTFWRLPVVGEHVTVKTEFVSDSRNLQILRAGLVGTVVQVDEEGDVRIESDELTERQWVCQQNFRHVTFWRPPVIGQHLTVHTEFMSNSTRPRLLRAGVVGTVVQVDEEGDIWINSDQLTKNEWVFQCNFGHITFGEAPDEFDIDSSSGGPAQGGGYSAEIVKNAMGLADAATLARMVGDGDKCTVCQEGFKVGEHVCLIKQCSCYFHNDCIMPWFEHSPTCPNCKRDIVTGVAEEVEDDSEDEEEDDEEEEVEEVEDD